MELLEKINKDMRKTLSDKRYNHSLGVMRKAKELATKYGIDEEKAMLVGLAHDIAKEIPKDKKIEYVQENNIEIDDIEKVNIELLHAKIGADICKKKYGFTEDMANAIKYHTTGNPQMDDLAKVIFIADKTEEGRKDIDTEVIKQMEEKGLNAEIVYLIDNSVKYTIDKGKLIHPDSIYTRNALITNM